MPPSGGLARALDAGGFSVLREGDAASVLCRREDLPRAVALLREHGVKGAIAAERVDYVFAESNPPYERLVRALKAGPGVLDSTVAPHPKFAPQISTSPQGGGRKRG
jgi:hypothetical protein